MSGTDRGAAAPAPAPTQLTPREKIAQLRAERAKSAPPPQSGRVLTLDTIDPEPRTIGIDGRDYRLRFYDELSVAEHAHLARTEKRANALVNQLTGDELPDLEDEGTIALSEELDAVYGLMVEQVLPTLPKPKIYGKPAVLDGDGNELEPAIPGLTFNQRRQVWLAFQAAQAERNARAGGRATPRARPTGGRSSTPSPPATGKAPATGRGKRRSASSSTPTTP